MTDGLTALVKQWREGLHPEAEHCPECFAYRTCADQLEAALAALVAPKCVACEEQPGTYPLCDECYTESCRHYVSAHLEGAFPESPARVSPAPEQERA